MHKRTAKCLSPEHLRFFSLVYVVSLAQTYENSTDLDVSYVDIAENSSQVLTKQSRKSEHRVPSSCGEHLSVLLAQEIFGVHRHLCSDSLKLKTFFFFFFFSVVTRNLYQLLFREYRDYHGF
ncbi:unnamed protein product [Pipistrellus nathusii]|uniref:Uncharacterized protein n=1 Tax=Pipistrellus nathusii TaxID=59473 RepID=A0ABP0AFI6_PIPNA